MNGAGESLSIRPVRRFDRRRIFTIYVPICRIINELQTILDKPPQVG